VRRRDRAALHATGLPALVGREEESELLLRRWCKAKTGEDQVVLLPGGIRKSQLTAALLESLCTEPHTRLRYFCSPQHTTARSIQLSASWSVLQDWRATTPSKRDSTSSTLLAQSST
jgi:predicted ATPase